MAGQKIVVGVDGSEGGRRALTWALNAQPLDAPVEAVMAWQREVNDAAMIGGTIAITDPEEERKRAEVVLANEIEDAVSAVGSDRRVTGQVILGIPGVVLAEAAHDAYMLILGSHGHGRLHHAFLGSVTEECIRQAKCPVLVIPVPQEENGSELPVTRGGWSLPTDHAARISRRPRSPGRR
ncbi:nucleotide-binding universal stress UspA family protein [Stackebrandtia endophytica]|uniref:Nucleotide-binding universal stress UspA family protein n=1 Tax=Stackebrandtia endophytica TaxID=1496996 RepID=A0A543AQG1_9ACTN|nr:universal stress protein [Stackebrandtia endophytica]TQL74822.1 nucleotide-binding universal stress UspA family protein [Stackebrandtia endophytica]